MKNVQGSSAGAGSGEFHVYKQSRRREYERLKLMDETSQKVRLNLPELHCPCFNALIFLALNRKRNKLNSSVKNESERRKRKPRRPKTVLNE